MITVTEYQKLPGGKLQFSFDNGMTFALYASEARRFRLKEDAGITEEDFRSLLDEVIGKRAKKRAMHLLERMDRTEAQLRQKLEEGGYPQICIDSAIAYVKSYHYVDDYRYACVFVRGSQEKMSRRQIRMKLMQRGVGVDLIERALQEEYAGDETEQISALLVKRHFIPGKSDEKEFRRTYQYLMRRGFQSGDILKAMNP